MISLYTASMVINLFKSILHNIGVTIVSFGVAGFGLLIDNAFDINRFTSSLAIFAGTIVLIGGFLLRVWATKHFYEHRMKVIRLEPQSTLLTSGPYNFTRNPLYLGGNVFMFFGACLIVGSTSGLILTAIGIIFTDRFIRREERQLAEQFGKEWTAYAKKVRRWL